MLASGPAFSAHGDYTVRSGFTRLQSLLKAHEAEDLRGCLIRNSSSKNIIAIHCIIHMYVIDIV